MSLICYYNIGFACQEARCKFVKVDDGSAAWVCIGCKTKLTGTLPLTPSLMYYREELQPEPIPVKVENRQRVKMEGMCFSTSASTDLWILVSLFHTTLPHASHRARSGRRSFLAERCSATDH